MTFGNAAFVDRMGFEAVLSMYDTFGEEQRQTNPTFTFSSYYLKMVQILLLFIRATHESDWDLHLAAARLMLP